MGILLCEDSNEFVSYYYKEKIQQNRILVKLDGNDVITMLHRNPYQVRMRKKHWNVDYVVGVATRYDRRKKGYMEKVLITCLNDMNREHMPFTFLMPVFRSDLLSVFVSFCRVGKMFFSESKRKS